MIDESTLQEFYSDVPTTYLDRFRSFLRTHSLERRKFEGTEVSYYACGRGDRTLLTFCGGHSTPDTAWETIETYENEYRIVVLDISGFGTVAALSRGINQILEQEGIDRVVLLGTSMAGIIAQIYFKHNFERVDGMVLINTLALKPGGDKPLILLLMKLVPGFILRTMFRKKFRAYFRQALAEPRAAEGARFGLAHLDEIMANHFTKKKLINLLSVFFEFAREGYIRADFAGWQGRILVVVSEDDAGFKDLDWFTDNLPNAESHTFPKGLGHLPQLAHKDKFERLIRDFLGQLT
jgi:pimeloyl-ACP methyl ester carboxylesterase